MRLRAPRFVPHPWPWFVDAHPGVLAGLVLALLGVLAGLAFGDPTTHRRPDSQRKLQVWSGDAAGAYVVSGCLPTVPGGSLSFAAFACEAYVRDTTTGELLWVGQASQAVGPLNGGNGTYWLAVSRDLSTSHSGWTRQGGTQYVWKLAATPPTTLSGLLQVAQVTVAGGAITAVADLRVLSPTARAVGVVLVNKYATGGEGTSSNPWTGWDTAITWASATYHFPCGTYSYATSPNFAVQGIRLTGTACTVLKYTGAGVAVRFNGSPTGLTTGVFDTQMSDFTIEGSVTATHGIHVSHTHHSTWRNIRLKYLTGNVFLCEFCVLNTLDTIVYSANEHVVSGGTGQAQNGILLKESATDPVLGPFTAATNILNPMIEGVSNVGIYLAKAGGTAIYGGASEANAYGLYITNGSGTNNIYGTDFEANTTKDVFVDAAAVNFYGGFNGSVSIGPNAIGGGWHGGNINDAVFDAAANVSFFGTRWQVSPTIADGSGATFYNNYFAGAGAYYTALPKGFRLGTLTRNTALVTVQEVSTTIAAAAFTDLNVTGLPSGALVVAVGIAVTTTIPTAATFNIVDQSTTLRLNLVNNLSTAAGTTDPGTNAGVLAGIVGARTFRLTPNASPAAATGVVKLAIYYIQVVVP